MFRYLLLILSFGFFLSCANDKFETPSDLGKAFFNTLKEIEDEEDISILHKFFLTKEEYQEFIGKSNLSKNDIESYNDMKNEFFKAFQSKILSNVLTIKSSNDLKALDAQIANAQYKNNNEEYEKLIKEEKKLGLKHFHNILEDAEFVSFSLSPVFVEKNGNELVSGNDHNPSHIEFQLEDKIYQFRIASLFKTRSGWKIYEL